MTTLTSIRRQPLPLPPVQPERELKLALPDGHVTCINPEIARALEDHIRRFRAAAEPWHFYRPMVKGFAECRCGADTETPGRSRWMWRKLRGTTYAALNRVTGLGRRGESLCPDCQRAWGVTAFDNIG